MIKGIKVVIILILSALLTDPGLAAAPRCRYIFLQGNKLLRPEPIVKEAPTAVGDKGLLLTDKDRVRLLPEGNYTYALIENSPIGTLLALLPRINENSMLLERLSSLTNREVTTESLIIWGDFVVKKDGFVQCCSYEYNFDISDGRGELDKAIVRLQSSGLNPQEVATAGRTIKPGGKFPRRIKDGHYIYLITDDDVIIYSDRLPFNFKRTADQYLVKHTSLYRQLHMFYDKVPKIVAAGEFKVFNGEIKELNNKSGVWHGDHYNLDWAARMLKKAGLGVRPNTNLVDYASLKQDPSHFKEAEAVRRILFVRNNPELMKEAALLKEFYQQFMELRTTAYANIAEPTRPPAAGTFDFRGVINHLTKKLIKWREGAKLANVYTPQLDATYWTFHQSLFRMAEIFKIVEEQGYEFTVYYMNIYQQGIVNAERPANDKISVSISKEIENFKTFLKVLELAEDIKGM